MASTKLCAHDQVDIDRYYSMVRNDSMVLNDKANHSTTNQVLDEPTLHLLNKLVSNGVLDRVLGSISVGKEANVFRAEKDGHEGAARHFALKIYKSSMMTFRKSRSKYVDPDLSFRKVYHGDNPRTLVREWARKEVRNLKKLNNAGIPSPVPIWVKRNVVLMTLVGSDTGGAAPLLANTKLSDTKLSQLYRDIVMYIRRMYVKCRIVHADLSEFNILYHDGKPYIIDVSQAVPLCHSHTHMFLRKDCHNVTDYFRKKGVATMPLDDLLDFVTDSNATEDDVDVLVQAAEDGAINHPLTDRSGEDVVDELGEEDDIDDKKDKEEEEEEKDGEEKDGEEEEERCSEDDRGGSPAKKIVDKRPKKETTEERKAVDEEWRNVLADYFRKKGVATMPLDDLLDFVTDSNATEDDVDVLVQAAEDGAINHPLTDRSGEDVVDELGEEDDIDDKKDKEEEEEEKDGEEKDGEEEEERCSEDDRGGSPAKKIVDKRPKKETTEERKERKRSLKQARREKLQTADTYSVKERKTKAAQFELSRVCVESFIH